MQTDAGFFVKLVGMSTFLEQQEDLDDSLNDFAAMAANIINVENCSIMLFREGDKAGDFRLRVFAKTGYLPENAFQEAVKVNDGIAGRVAATGQALLVEDDLGLGILGEQGQGEGEAAEGGQWPEHGGFPC